MKSHELLRLHFEKKRRANPNFSLRGLAKRLDISSAFLSKILSGKKPLPIGRVRSVAKALDLDVVELRKLERVIFREQNLSPETKENLEFELEEGGGLSALPSEAYAPESAFSALDEWYYLPILDLVTCQGFDPSWIEQRLGLRAEVAHRAWEHLRAQGWVSEENGKWVKKSKKLRYPSHKIDARIQRFHTAMLKKAADHLAHRKEEADFARRLVVGASVATNQASYDKACKYLEEAMFRACDMLTEGPADRVYYMAFQLFPLTLPRK